MISVLKQCYTTQIDEVTYPTFNDLVLFPLYLELGR